MERSWSETALAAFEAYPWQSPQEKARARTDTELVAFGPQVEDGDLPLRVRRWMRERKAGPITGWIWRGESWRSLTEGFEREILSQALAAHGGFVAKAARALATTPRVVAYKARKYGLPTRRTEK